MGCLFRKVNAVFMFQMRQIFSSWKNPCILILTGMFVWLNVQPIGDFGGMVRISAHPWIFPHLTNDFICQLVLCAGCVAIFCDAPWDTPINDNVLVRSGKAAHSMGQMFYILVLALFFTLFLYVISVIALFPNVEFAEGWGKVIGTLARTDAGSQIKLSFVINDFLIGAYSPGKAVILSIMLEWACFTWLGMIMYLFNKHVGKFSGVFASSSFILLDITVANEITPFAYHFSPITLAQLSAFQGRNAQHGISLEYAVMFFICGIVFMIIGNLLFLRRKTS